MRVGLRAAGLRARLNAVLVLALTGCPRKSGAVFLAIEDTFGGKFRVSELVIEVKLTADARQALRLRAAAGAAAELLAR